MEFRLLGPVEVRAEGRSISLGGLKPQNLLAALLLEHDRVMPVTRLIDIVWSIYLPERTAARVANSALRRSTAFRLVIADREDRRDPDGTWQWMLKL
ncbi:hypothetical protein [Nonomuraea sp. NEAU-A123]|uniref:AfsR/SARP family transcriptional regulator n=1 Tax=Nonomuraea sp. NEAU-A123 TaxID=2839649 RepID=UPI001BE433FE|nr:hypothetical protein [Nonomuraea sp. NEAU-A123]MBT2233566.1 hypothetical protein [Nonomuraea sp. NEAU-A123]